MADLTSQSVTTLKGIGPQLAEKLARLHIHNVQDVLFHLPHRYEDRTKITPIGSARPNQFAVVVGQIELAQVVYGRRRSLLVQFSDGTGAMIMRLFYFSKAQEKAFKRGLWLQCVGEIRFGTKKFELIHPEYVVLAEKPLQPKEKTLTPVYPTTEGIGQSIWRKLTEQVLTNSLQSVQELLPQTITSQYGFDSLQEALKTLHRPPAQISVEQMQAANSKAHQRLIFEELLAQHLSLRMVKQKRGIEKAIALPSVGNRQEFFLDSLAFKMTNAQQRVCKEIIADMSRTMPMMRLLQGDVGSGKTVVAAYAILQAISNQVQSVLMAPTELLAEQHYSTLCAWFQPLSIEVGWLSGKTPAKQRSEVLQKLINGEYLVVVGTHALFQEGVNFKQLGLVVIDEQHRFGVNQRLALRNKGAEDNKVGESNQDRQQIIPHQLLMTATPIPRTLAMSFYADLDVSSIDEMPLGRRPVETVVMSAQQKRQEIVQRVYSACKEGRQVYWVCPLIDESEKLSAQAASETEQELKKALKGIRIGLIHGRMKTAEKEQVMTAFRNAEISLLVATTVIEVGVDVPNASLMIIENAERMGLSQLHQLRGRVGRGEQHSVCVLLYQQPLSEHAKIRLQTLRQTNDGFEISQKDLELRGPGEMLGTRQTGALSFRVANLVRDQHWLPKIERIAGELITNNPDKIQLIIKRWIGSREDFANA